MPHPLYVGLMTYDVKDPDTKYPQIQDLRPPEGAPNVLVILIDAAGFRAPSPFGGPCQTPNFEKLAASGLKYNRFHTTVGSCPTGQSGSQIISLVGPSLTYREARCLSAVEV